MHDPSGRYLEQRANARLAILRHAAIYVPSTVLLGGLLLWAIPALPGSIIAVVFLSIGVLAVTMEAYHAVADLLRSEPVTSRGIVDRMWAKGRFLFIGRVRYLLLEARPVEDGKVDLDRKPRRHLFEITPESEFELYPGDEIEVVHWPHTNTIVTLEKLRSSAEQSSSNPPPTSGPLDWGNRPR